MLFVHGAGTPAEVAFDAPIGTHSWMAYLAQAGFDVFSMDTTGYGRSTRPAPMNDPCNLADAQQAQFIPSLIAAPCKPPYPGQLTTIGSDWHDIDAVVDHIRALRGVAKVSLVAWSLGGPRAGGYAAQHPDKVHRLVLFAPAYNRTAAATPPSLPSAWRGVQHAVARASSSPTGIGRWDVRRSTSPEVRDAVWAEMLASDPVGATWGTGVRRAPSTTTWGWNQAAIAGTKIPTLMIAGVLDKQVHAGSRARSRSTTWAPPTRCSSISACSSHNAMWESEPPADVQGVARLAHEGRGRRAEIRCRPARLLTADVPMSQHAITQEAHGHKGAFVIDRDGVRLATMTYTVAGDDLVIIDHTDVSDALRGTGAGKALVDARRWSGRGASTRASCRCARLPSRCSTRRPTFSDVRR